MYKHLIIYAVRYRIAMIINHPVFRTTMTILLVIGFSALIIYLIHLIKLKKEKKKNGNKENKNGTTRQEKEVHN